MMVTAPAVTAVGLVCSSTVTGSYTCASSVDSLRAVSSRNARLKQMFLRLSAVPQFCSQVYRRKRSVTRVIHHFIHPGGEHLA